jgi:hypothetical protein
MPNHIATIIAMTAAANIMWQTAPQTSAIAISRRWRDGARSSGSAANVARSG